MGEMNIYIPQLDKTFSIDVGYNDTFKAKKNRSFSSASPCCEVELKQEKKCGSCGKVVGSKDVEKKILKVGKQKVIIPADRLKEIENNVEGSESEITIKAIYKGTLPYHRIDGSKWVYPAKKRTRDYLELKELCKSHTLIGETIFKSNGYEIGLTTIDDTLVVIKFATETQMGTKPSLDLAGVSINPEIVKVQKEILDRDATTNYDFSAFEDIRTKQVDELIEKIALGEEEMPETPIAKEEKKIVDDTTELERLKELYKKTKGG